MPIPVPGQPVRGSKSGKPIMAVFDLLGRSWALGIIWNLSRGSATFRELQSVCESISPTILNKRLKELKEAGLVDRSLDGYILTEQGSELFTILEPFGKWSVKWAKQMAPELTEEWDNIGKHINRDK
ncbi:MAG: winged helix-turn-helix transcriptional regulator [Deferribacterales bacterium]